MTSRELLPEAPWELIQRYDPAASVLFASPRQTLLAECRFADSITISPAQGLADAVQAALERAQHWGDPAPLALGAIPFDPQAGAWVMLPHAVALAEPLPAAAPIAPAAPALTALEAVFGPEDYAAGVRQALTRMDAGELRKVVLARALELTAQAPLDVRGIVASLAQRNPLGYTFAVPLPEQRTLVGASPELLLARRGQRIVSHPLAGSVPRAADPVEDTQRAAALLQSAKDQHEHALVVEAVAATLRPFCRELNVPAPALVPTPTMWHLATRITGELRADAPSALHLALALHPTPAVCGTPTELARRVIGAIEPFERGFFTGLVGWCDASGDGEWAITIRCAEIADRSARLLAGAGIVPGSQPAAEVAETAGKLRTMLLALGLESELAL